MTSPSIFSAALTAVARGLAALSSAFGMRAYPAVSRTPFTDDRSRLREDWRQVEKDLGNAVREVKQSEFAKPSAEADFGR